MGCCCSCEEDSANQGPVNERSPLLNGNTSAPVPNNQRAGDDGITTSATPISKTDEQSMLNRILHQTANNVIDVSSTEPHSLERTEYLERSRLYLSKLSAANVSHLPKGRPLPSGVTAPSTILAADPIAPSDVNLVISAAKGAEDSLTGFHVNHKEPLVVPFGST
ncbi:predicted protein [Nematostella vectensis]|uniref:Ragulator complex protein LAMTOR1 n=1 Tax=Nematostella vectensis TaxID=45351 RepID=A7RFI0_NEMVE|nr:ragulator complex protein LAMTOR1 [Nematostella vectensis]EDO49725.1 predicted protein [Nematostella vectensis]|eukprot:XP_001641788.1 predicted protein [Nematostella vectensis]